MVRTALLISFLSFVPACMQQGLESEESLVELDENYFRCQVQPVLVKHCAFFACHGSNTRPFRVYARERLRFEVAVDQRGSPLTDKEERFNYDRSLSFAQEGPDGPMLLLKPVASRIGGYYHGATEQFAGRDVFTQALDPGFVILSQWLDGASAESNCQETEEVGL